jgi:hypothetical protein
MDQVWPEVMINGAVALFLWGMVWRANGLRLDKIEQRSAQGVEREYCRLQHRQLREDLDELKGGHKEVMEVLGEIQRELAQRNGEEIARRSRD